MDNDKITEKKKFKRPLLHKIINVFIGLFGTLLFLLIIFFGFSQTKTFRNYLKDKISETVSESINGDLTIENIEGSILSSIILQKTSLTSNSDTLFSADEITLKTSPIHLLLKRILIRDLILKNSKIKLLEDKEGKWNVSQLVNSENEEKSVTSDSASVKSSFPFGIQVNNLIIQNLNFVRQTFKNVNSNRSYKFLTETDLQLKELSLEAKLFLNLASSTARLKLINFSVRPNFEAFNLNNLTGEFELNEDFASVKNLVFISDSSNIKVNAKLDDLNLLGGVELKGFKEYPLHLDLEAFPLQFSDLYTFINDIEFLNDKVFLSLKADGYFGDFDIKNLRLSFLNSILNVNGKLQKLHTPENLYLDVNITDSKIVEEDVYKIIEGLNIPLYKDLKLNNLNASFKGEPTKFKARLTSNIGNGSISCESYLDLQSEQMVYDVKYNAKRIDLFPIIGLSTLLTSNGKIKGYGTDPNLMSTDLQINAFNSIVDSIDIDSLYFTTSINSKLLDLELSTIINGAITSVQGHLNLIDENEPIYDLMGAVKNLQLSRFTGNPRDSSNLNLKFLADGSNLTVDEMKGNYEISLEQSYLRNLALDETSIKLSIAKDELNRDINLKSDFVDFNIDGQFSLQKAIDILAYEGNTISKIINNKINELNPIYETDSLLVEAQTESIPSIANEDLEFNFNFVFKEFDLIAEFLKNDELDIVGSGAGKVKNDSLHFEISTDIYIDNLLNKKRNEILYFSEIESNLNFSRDNRTESFNKIFGTLSIEGNKIYSGFEMNNLIADLVFNQSKLFFNTSFSLEDEVTAEIEGMATTFASDERIKISNLTINYKNLPWVNYDTCIVIFNEDGIQLSNLVLNNGSTVFDFDAQINNDESHNFFVNIESMPGEVLSAFLFEPGAKPLGGDLNLKLSSTGFLKNPKINLDLYVFDISYNDINFGTLSAVASHFDNNTLFDLDFNNYDISRSLPLLTVDASFRLKINFLDMKNLLVDDSEIYVSLRSNNFNIGAFGNILPLIKEQTGNFSSVVDIEGPLNNLTTNGYITLEQGRFTLRENNLDYAVSLKTKFRDQIATIEEISLSNSGGSRYSGKILGKGKMLLDEFPFSEFELILTGDLALLGRKSQTKNSNMYGDLFIVIQDNLNFKFKEDLYSVKGDIIIERADLNYSAQKNLNNFSNDRIIYIILEDTSKINIKNQKFVKILNETQSNSIELTKVEKTKFDINTNIIVRNIASLNFLISPELNQRLRIETTGQLEFETIGNETKAQGSLTLMNGSRLEFFKTFDAAGTIRFENDITDPYFDIVATYVGEIENFENSDRTEEVGVKLKLLTTFSELRQNISGNNNNLTVYVGRSQIENDIPDPRYDQSNALTFVIFDQLNLNLNDEQRSTLGSLTENAAYSLLGSQLTNYLNSSLGGLISNIKLNKYSGRDSYKLLFSGKYNNIRYSFGGSFGSQTDYLQLSKADIRVEYLFNPNFMIRLEQKDPIIETTTQEKIQEVGLKYKFEF